MVKAVPSQPPSSPPPPASELLLVSVGNSRTRLARATRAEGRNVKLEPSHVYENTDPVGLARAARALAEGFSAAESAALIASVNDPVADVVATALAGSGPRVYRFGAGLPVPMVANLRESAVAGVGGVGGVRGVGVDRLLAAVGAFARSQQACVVIDAGTAITVDYVDQWGVFQGGCIAPGLKMMLRGLHEQTSKLPLVAPPRAEELPELLGKNTTEAMQRGCVAALRGMVRLLIDQYAEVNNGYPRVVATGGDAPLLFEGDDLVEHIVPDLVLVGMVESFARLCAGEDGEAAAPAPTEAAGENDDDDDDDESEE